MNQSNIDIDGKSKPPTQLFSDLKALISHIVVFLQEASQAVTAPARDINVLKSWNAVSLPTKASDKSCQNAGVISE